MDAIELIKSLSSVPSAAIPSILDCILTSIKGESISSTSLFHSLLQAFKPLLLSQDCGQPNVAQSTSISSFTTALCYLLKKSGTDHSALQAFIWEGYLPTIKILNVNHHELLNLMAEQLSDVVIKSNTWKVLDASLVPFCLRSIGTSIGMCQNEETSVYQWSDQSVMRGQSSLLNDSIADKQLESLPLAISCHVLTSLLLTSLTTSEAQQNPPERMLLKGSSAHVFSTNLLWDICAMAIQMLSQSPEHRSCATHLLLPHILRIFARQSSFQLSVHGKIHVLSRGTFFQKIWKHCGALFSHGPGERRDAYSILSLCLSILSPKEDCEDITICEGVGEFDIRTEQGFWDEIKRGLVDKEAFVRKQSLNMLKMLLIVNDGKQSYPELSENYLHDKSATSLGMTRRGQWAEKEAKSLGVGKICDLTDPQSDGQKKWNAFILLYEMLEEYGTHLVEAAWNHQISMLLHFPCPLRSSWDVNIGVYQSQMETLDGVFSWLAVLWERGLCHDNPQVRCLIMQSFLSIEWKDHKSCTELVPESFITGPFIQALNDTAHHREFGVQGVYSSNTIECATSFVAQYCKLFNWRERVEFMCRLTSLVKQESFGRAGLMAFSGCIASAAYGVQWCEVCSCDLGQMESEVESLPHDSKADLLDMLRLVIESCKQHFNLNYRHQVCKNVLEAASSVICISGIPMETLMHFISTVPRELTDYGGSLRESIQKWFSKCSETLQSSGCSRTRKHALHSLCDFPKQFVGYHHSPDAVVTCDDGDLEAWEVEAQRWARVLLLVTINKEHLDIILKFLQNCGTDINRQHSYLHFLPSKFLIINLCLVQELHIMRMKSIGSVKVRSNMETQGFGSDRLLSTDTSAIFEKFTLTFLMILEELVSFAKSACSTFWCCPVVNVNLPSSVNGKLGGPSQRRLASSTTTVVLEAIISMKTVASLSSWCTYFKSDESVDCMITFLWSFSKKVILCPKSNLDSETGAEISLAAYEALVPVLKAVASSVSPLLSNLIMASDESLVPKVENQHWIETLLLCFLRNVNELLGVGRLARSRRAVLMNWKWLCLSSLLSIFYWMKQNGSQFGSGIIFISTASLKSVYSDIIGSLENAGESSVLPMFRSVRLILELFALGRLDSTVLSPDGLTTEMIWDLVNSSWILHVNCNKRRVAHIAALLSSVLHCSVFCDDMMHGTSEDARGPCKWFIEKIVEEGTKSPRTIRLAALHLTGLWLMYPRTIRYYVKELKILSLYGSVAFDEDFEAELAESSDAKTEVSLLAKGLDIELTEAFMNTELYARVSVAVLFHELANVADKVGTAKESEDCHAARHAGKAFLLELLDSVLNDKDLAKELYKKYSAIHRRKVRAWQMLCVLSRFVDEDIVQHVTSSLHICLYRNNMPSVRQYLEIFAVQIYLKFPSLVEEQLSSIFRDYNMKPQALASYVFIAANIILHAPEESIRLRHLSELLPPITPLLTSHHHSLRGFTQLLVYKVLSKMMLSLGSSNSESVPLEKRCFEDLKCYLEKNSDCARLRASMEGFIDTFDISKCATPAGIFIARDEGVDFECVPTSLMEQLNDFLNEVRDELRCSMAKDSVIIKNESLTNISPLTKENSQVPKDISLDFQKKIILAKHELCEAPLVDLEKEDELVNQVLQRRNMDMERMKASRQEIIVVASLIDRIPNLAGLARTCEVFNASAIAVADASVVNDKQFQLISVTAEKWVPIIEVPVGSLKVYLKKKKGEGYSILGLEQTANSVGLDEYELPKKMVLVLGREKEGIPVDIIHMVDTCVEIPQLGVVRSLNVHVSGAIALWEYTRQHRKLNNKSSS